MKYGIDFKKCVCVQLPDDFDVKDTSEFEIVGGLNNTEAEAWKAAFIDLRNEIINQIFKSITGGNMRRRKS